MFDIRRVVTMVTVSLGIAMVEASQKEWFETTTIYEVYTRSFKDSDGDGIGDLKGVHEKLDYIESIGCETVWIQAIHKSPMVDMGYDISDFRDIDPIFGTLSDLKDLIKAIHDRGMKVMLDFVPNHTSNECEWFQKSVRKEEPYTGYYVWKDPIGYDSKTQLPIPPNNWLSFFSGSMWQWNEQRQQFYLHQFHIAQPDLDYRNPAVREAMKDVLRFWLDMGVDGFRVDAVTHLIEDELLRDEPWRSPEMAGSKQYMSQIHIHTYDLDETYEITHEWRMLFDEFERKDNITSNQFDDDVIKFDEKTDEDEESG